MLLWLRRRGSTGGRLDRQSDWVGWLVGCGGWHCWLVGRVGWLAGPGRVVRGQCILDPRLTYDVTADTKDILLYVGKSRGEAF